MHSKNHMNMLKFAISVEESFKINMLNIKNIAKLEIIAIKQVNVEVLQIAYRIQNIVFLKSYHNL